MLLHASTLDFGGRFGGQNLGHVLPLVCSRFLNWNKQTLLLPLKAKWHPTKAKRVGLPGRGRLACGPPRPAFRSPTLLLLVKRRSRMVAVLGALLQQHQRACLSPTRLSAGRPTSCDKTAKRREMRRRRVNSRQKRWWTSNRGAAKVGRASRPEHPESVYTGRPRARRLGARPANDSVAAAHAICYPAAKKI